MQVTNYFLVCLMWKFKNHSLYEQLYKLHERTGNCCRNHSIQSASEQQLHVKREVVVKVGAARKMEGVILKMEEKLS